MRWRVEPSAVGLRSSGLVSRPWRPFRPSQLPASDDIYTVALRLLARRELTVAQTRERLDRKSFGRSQVEAALSRLLKEGALDDARAASAIARRNAARRRGPSRAVRELEAAGINQDVARRTVREVFANVDEQTLIDAALERKLRGPVTDQAVFRRLHAYLVRQGFSSAGAFHALKGRTHQLPEDFEK